MPDTEEPAPYSDMGASRDFRKGVVESNPWIQAYYLPE
jgi:hypothetical protein